jgi:hypothetical protein
MKESIWVYITMVLGIFIIMWYLFSKMGLRYTIRMIRGKEPYLKL